MATTKKTSTKTIKKATKKTMAAEQMTLVDALPVAVEPPAPAPRATRVAAPPVPEAQPPAPVEASTPTLAPKPAPVEDKPRRAEDMGPQKVRAALHPEHNSRGRGRSEAEKRESYARYRANKKKAKELEERNTRHLILFPASDADTNAEKFYNMGGNSAIIYCHELGPRLKRNPVLRRDMDLGPDRFHSGVCSISNLESLTQRLAEIGVKRQSDCGELVIFKLAREYPKDEIREMLKQEQEQVRNYTEMAHGDVDAKTAAGKMMRELFEQAGWVYRHQKGCAFN